MVILGRVVRWTEEGLEYEADQRHAEIIVEATGMANCNSVVTPGEEDMADLEHQAAVELTAAEASTRALAARANYLAADRADIQFAVKELSKAMANPKMSDWDSLVNFARYLIGKEKHVQLFKYQRAMADFSLKHITVWSDTDYAGDPISRKSTSGGVCMLGNHVIKS